MKLKCYSAQTHQGPYLQVNEDGYDFDLINGLFMIFDGFGGSGIGDEAVLKLKSYIKTFYSRIYVDQDSTMPFYFSHKYLIEGNALINALFYAHKLLLKENTKVEMGKRAGASGSFVSVSENLLTLATVGNTQTYLLRNSNLEKLFAEDSLKNVIGTTFHDTFRTIPLSAFGLFQDFHYQIREIKILEGDMLVLMTDGVYARLNSDELRSTLEKSKMENYKKIQSVFNLVNDRGNLDNQTMMILQF